MLLFASQQEKYLAEMIIGGMIYISSLFQRAQPTGRRVWRNKGDHAIMGQQAEKGNSVFGWLPPSLSLMLPRPPIYYHLHEGRSGHSSSLEASSLTHLQECLTKLPGDSKLDVLTMEVNDHRGHLFRGRFKNFLKMRFLKK